MLYVRRNTVSIGKLLYSLIGFHILLIVYIINEFVVAMTLRMRFLPRPLNALIVRIFARIYEFTVRIFDKNSEGTISRVDLIQLAIRNMKAKKTRSIITVSGMSIGIGAIVFLVSLGYGIENLVTSRVARLDEMSQTDISPQTGGKVRINDETIATFKDIPDVKLVLPQIAIVGRVNYNNSVSDMAVYGVTSDYLKQSAIKPVKGKIFDSNDISVKVSDGSSKEIEEMAELPEPGVKTADVTFTIEGKTWKKVRKEAKADGAIVGYLNPQSDPIVGEEVWGDTYDTKKKMQLSEDGVYGKWIKANYTVYDKKKCDIALPECVDGEYVRKSVPQPGFVSQVDTLVSYNNEDLPEVASFFTTEDPDRETAQLIAMARLQEAAVLGDETATPSAALSQSASDSAALAELVASESATLQTAKIDKVDLPKAAIREAVVNTSMLRILGLTESQAVGKKFAATFVIVGSLLDKKDAQVESNPADYTIIGVVPDDKTPYFYVPFVDLRGLGITTYSQLKVVSNSQKNLPQIRKKIESLGYSTRSVADTVAQINSIFGTARLLLALLGMVALSIASLGMFNTLTVSLLERTREVGLMKAMGMKSTEVRELFLTESMIMGIFGGLFGLLTGYLMGKTLGAILSIFSISKGAGFLDISYIPGFFVTIIIVLSLIVGIVTGLYPARRATKISALNALRYE